MAREPRLMARRVRDDADPDLVKRTYEAMVARWADAGALLARGVKERMDAVLEAVVEIRVNVAVIHRRDAKALFALDCTYCSQKNYVIFAPESGEVVDVMDRLQVLRLPEPSLN